MQENIKMQCFPLYSILKAIERTSIDYISLDVEGSEYGVMHTAFQYNNDLKFNIASVETTYLDVHGFGASWMEMRYLMRSEGYELHKHIGEDDIFIRKGFSLA